MGDQLNSSSLAARCKAWREPPRSLRGLILLAAIAVPQFLLFGPSLVGTKILLPLDLLKFENFYLPPSAEDLDRPPEAPRFIPQNPLLSDLILVIEPWRVFAVSEVRAGRMPLWNPYIYCGSPFLATNQAAVFSPFRVLDYLLPGTLVIAWVQMVKSLVAGVGTYLFFRRVLAVSYWPAVIGAAAFPLSGFMLQWQGYPNSNVVAWLPWLLLGTAFTTRNPRGWAPLGLTIGVGFILVSGHAATALQALMLVGIYAVWCLVERCRAVRFNVGRVSASVVALTAACGLGGLLSAPQSLPTRDYLKMSDRLETRHSRGDEAPPIGWAAVPQFIMPDIWGAERPNHFFAIKGTNRLESGASGYAGYLFAMVFAPLAFLNRSFRWQGVFWIVVGALAASYLVDVPIVKWIFQMPPFNSLRNQRFVFVTAWAVLVLGVMGMESVQNGLVRWNHWMWIPIAIIALCGIWWLWWAVSVPDFLEPFRGTSAIPKFRITFLTGAFLAALAIGYWLLLINRRLTLLEFLGLGSVAVAELLWFGIDINTQADPALYYPNVRTLTELQQLPPGRVCASETVLPNLFMMTRLMDLRGYDGVDPREYVELIRCGDKIKAEDELPGQRVGRIVLEPSPVFDALNLRYLVYRGLVTDERNPRINHPELTYFVLENRQCLPRTYLPRTVCAIPDRTARLAALSNPYWDPAEVAFTEVDCGLTESAFGSAQITAELPNQLTVRYEASQDGLLVLSDSWDAGWKAFLGDREVPVLRTNHALRGVKVPPGIGQVVFRYEPASFYLGLWLAAWAAGGLAVWLMGVLVGNGRWGRSSGPGLT